MGSQAIIAAARSEWAREDHARVVALCRAVLNCLLAEGGEALVRATVEEAIRQKAAQSQEGR